MSGKHVSASVGDHMYSATTANRTAVMVPKASCTVEAPEATTAVGSQDDKNDSTCARQKR